MQGNDFDYTNTSLSNMLLKLKNRKALCEFLFSIGWHLPNFSCYSHEFVFSWLQGKKQVSFILNFIFLFSSCLKFQKAMKSAYLHLIL